MDRFDRRLERGTCVRLRGARGRLTMSRIMVAEQLIDRR